MNPSVIDDDFISSTLKGAIALYGVDAQLKMVIEECGELIQAICKTFRKPNDAATRLDLLLEIADVEIMLTQLRYILDADDEIDTATATKIIRLYNRMNPVNPIATETNK